MKLVKKKISDLNAAIYNPRKVTPKQMAEIEQSITKFGLVEPIIVNTYKGRENVIVGGHRRREILVKKGEKFTYCVEVCLNKEDEKELNIRLNKNTGDFDNELLKDFFQKDQLSHWGFEDFETNDIFGDGIPGTGDGDGDSEREDEGEEEGKKPEPPKDLSGNLSEEYKIEVDCADEFEQEQLFEQLTEMGLKCRVLTL
jgi:hypothetical protein